MYLCQPKSLAARTSRIHMRCVHQLIERIAHVAVMVDRTPRAPCLNANASLAQRHQHRFGDGAKFVVLGVEMHECDVRPIVGEQQGDHRFGDLRVRRPRPGERGKVALIGGGLMRAELCCCVWPMKELFSEKHFLPTAIDRVSQSLTYEIIGRLKADAMRPSCTHVSCGPM